MYGAVLTYTSRPIETYHRQGVAYPGVVKENHGIAFASLHEPPYELSESPGIGERSMLLGIRIIPRDKRDKLDKMMRIDFSRMYRVEHKTSVWVYHFGDIDKDHIERLLRQWVRTSVRVGQDEQAIMKGSIGAEVKIVNVIPGVSVDTEEDDPGRDCGMK